MNSTAFIDEGRPPESDNPSVGTLPDVEGAHAAGAAFATEPKRGLARGHKRTPQRSSATSGIRYVLEIIQDGAPIAAMPLPYQPEFKRIGKRPATRIRRTLGETPIRDHTEDRKWTIQCGNVTPVGAISFNKIGDKGDQATIMPGIHALIHFDAFLASYQQLASVEGSLYLAAPEGTQNQIAQYRDRCYLKLHDFDEGYAWRVEIMEFDWDRSIRETPVAAARWLLTMEGYALERGALTDSVVVQNQADFKHLNRKQWFTETALLADIMAGFEPKNFQNAASVQRTLRALSHPALGWSPSKALRSALSAVRAPFLAFGAAVNKVRSAIDTGSKFAQFPAAVVADAVGAANLVLKAVRDVHDAGFDWRLSAGSTASSLGAIYGAALVLKTQFERDFGDFGGLPAMLAHNLLVAADPSSPLDGSGLTGGSGPLAELPSLDAQSGAEACAVHVCTDEDTWQTIAHKYFGSADPWAVVAAFNGSSDAYSLADGGPLYAGAIVYVPGVSGTDATHTPASGMKNPGVYGSTYAFDFEKGDIVLGQTSALLLSGEDLIESGLGKADLSLVSGPSAWWQALQHRSLTEKHELPYAPNDGLFPAVGSVFDAESAAFSAADVAAQYMRDPRTASVSDVNTLVDQDKAYVEATVVGVLGDDFGASVPLL